MVLQRLIILITSTTLMHAMERPEQSTLDCYIKCILSDTATLSEKQFEQDFTVLDDKSAEKIRKTVAGHKEAVTLLLHNKSLWPHLFTLLKHLEPLSSKQEIRGFQMCASDQELYLKRQFTNFYSLENICESNFLTRSFMCCEKADPQDPDTSDFALIPNKQ